MNIGKNGLELIKHFEGCRLEAYRDMVGVLTIGWGHIENVYVGQKITQTQADQMLINDLKSYGDRVDNLVTITINQNQFDGLTSFAYNLGVQALAGSTLLKDVNAKNFQDASQQFLRWNHAGGEVVAGLTIRRQAESALFMSPVTPLPLAYVKYTVVSGDNLSHIASKYNVTVDSIVKLNGLKDANSIYVGQVLKIK